MPNQPLKKLNSRHERFCELHLLYNEGTRAAVEAGFSKKSAHITACLLLKDPKVKARLADLRAAQTERTLIDADTVKHALYRIATADLRLAFKDDGSMKLPKDIPDEVAVAMGSIEIKGVAGGKDFHRKLTKMSQLQAWELLGRHLGMFVDRSEVTLSGSLPARIAEGRRQASSRREK